jgi:hypothetical protein
MSNFQIYLDSVGATPLLTAEQEIELGHLIQRGQASDATPLERERGLRAKEQMIKANTRLVMSIVKNFSRSRCKYKHLQMEDLSQEGCIGLQTAAEKFDPTRGYKFSTYAYWWILQALKKAFANQEPAIRIPMHVRDQAHRVRRLQREAALTGEKVSAKELAKRAKANLETLEQSARVQGIASLNYMMGSASDTELISIIGSKESNGGLMEDLGVDREQIESAISSLPEKMMSKIIRRHFGLTTGTPETLDEIAKSLSIGKEKTKELKNRGLLLLKIKLTEQGARL